MSDVMRRPAKPPRRTQAERRSGSARGLVQAAIAVVAQEGVGAVTFDAVGREAGFSRGLASQHFGSKQGLIEAVIAHLQAREAARLVEIDAAASSGLEAVLAYVDLGLADMAGKGEGQAYVKLLSSAIAEGADLRATFAANHAKVQQHLAAMLRKGQVDGSVQAGVDCDATALMIGCLLFGLAMQLLVDPGMEIAPLREIGLSSLRRGLSA
jgi:AcrR family transcriptional regulator